MESRDKICIHIHILFEFDVEGYLWECRGEGVLLRRNVNCREEGPR